MENRTSRLTLLIDPDKKRIFEDICAAQDLTPSQVVRKLIRQYILENAGNRELPAWLVANSATRTSPLPIANDPSQTGMSEKITAGTNADTDAMGENS